MCALGTKKHDVTVVKHSKAIVRKTLYHFYDQFLKLQFIWVVYGGFLHCFSNVTPHIPPEVVHVSKSQSDF
jgi:hypothetical protein